MARTMSSPSLSTDMTTVNLSRLLSRLDKKLPPVPTTDHVVGGIRPPLEELPGAVERRKIAANLEYARQLLLHLETEYATVKNSAQRKKVQEDLGRKKAVIRRLNERLHGVEQLETMWEDEEERAEKEKAKVEREKEHSETAGIEPSSTLRNRLGQAPEATATSTSISTGTSKPASTKTSTINPSSPQSSGPVELEKQLSLQQRQQDDITADLLAMSRALKESSLKFGQQLEEEKPYLDMAAQGLDKNVLGMQSMGGRMDQLRKDGSVGWYRTLINMAIIVVLGIVGLIILMLPKLRR